MKRSDFLLGLVTCCIFALFRDFFSSNLFNDFYLSSPFAMSIILSIITTLLVLCIYLLICYVTKLRKNHKNEK